jgi:hypothetical protein
VFVLNYSYEVPNLSRKWDNIIVKALFDDWQISGVTTFTNGTYGGLGYSYSNVPTGTLTGTGSINGGGSRPIMTCDPNLSNGDATFERQFNTECVAPPTDKFRLGTATSDEYLGLGYMNWDISFFKNVPLGGSRRLQLRAELYNAFNTDQWTGVNTNANLTTGRALDQCEHVRQVDRRHQQRARSGRRQAPVLIAVSGAEPRSADSPGADCARQCARSPLKLTEYMSMPRVSPRTRHADRADIRSGGRSAPRLNRKCR